MAALLVRSAMEDKLRVGDSSSNGGARRSRKAKNGPKKQPQRGLGVAQLEKLRLQEQSKQEAACLASLGVLLPVGAYAGLEQQLLRHSFASKQQQQQHLQQHQHQHHHLQHQQHQQPQHLQQQQLQLQQQLQPQQLLVMRPHFDSGGVQQQQQQRQQQQQQQQLELKRQLGVPAIPKELSSFQTKYPGSSSSSSTCVWPTLHNASVQQQQQHPLHQQQQQHPLHQQQQQPPPQHPQQQQNKRVLQENSAQSCITSEDQSGAHYTPRSISSALGKSSISHQLGGPFLNNNSSSSMDSSLPPPAKRMMLTIQQPSSSSSSKSDFLALRLSISSEAESSSSSVDRKSLSSMPEETVTDAEECDPRSPSYGSPSMDFDLPPNKCSDIDLSLKL